MKTIEEKEARRMYLERMGIGYSSRSAWGTGGEGVDTSTEVGHAKAVLASKDLGAPVPASAVRKAVSVLRKAGEVVRR